MGYMRLHLPNQLAFFLAMVVSSASPVIAQRDSIGTGEQARKISPKFIDTTSSLEINCWNVASHTPKKYLIETMGPGVALFDHDNDGRLDIFVVNGAPGLSEAEKKFRRIKGYQEILLLKERLNPSRIQQKEVRTVEVA